MRKMVYGCFLACLLAATSARAQQVELTNGDHLSGKWLRVEGTTIEFRSDVLGKVEIPAAKVRSLAINQPLVVILKSGATLSGDRAQLAADRWTVVRGAGSKQLPAATVASIVPAAAYRAAVSPERAKPWRGWKGNVTFGYSLQNGDQNARTVSLGMNAVRRQPDLAGLQQRWRTSYSFNLLFANASTAGQQVSSNSLTTSLRQDYFFRPHTFLFALGELDHIQSQNLYLRQTYGGGFGRDLLTTGRVRLSLFGGATFANEKFTGAPAGQFAEALIGEHATIQFNRKIQLDHSFNFYPNLSNAGDYRFDTASTLGFQLNSWLSANLGLTDFYVSRIPAGSTTLPAHHNNVTVTAGLGVHF